MNPVFIITGWKADAVRVAVDGVARDGPAVRQQKRGDELVVWLGGTFDRRTRVRFEAE